MKTGTNPDETLVERAEEIAEVEGDAVVDERLSDEEREPEHRTLRVALECCLGDFAERDRLDLLNLDRVVRVVELLAGLALDALLDIPDDLLRLILAAVDEQPARALGHVPAHDHDRQCEDGSEPERDPPTDVRREHRAQEEQRGARASRRAGPVGTVDDQVDASAHAGRNQLVDRRIDRRILATDSRPGKKRQR